MRRGAPAFRDEFATTQLAAVDPSGNDRTGLTANLAVTDHAAGLGAIAKPGTNLAVYFWTPSGALRREIDRVAAGALPEMDVMTIGAALPGLSSGQASPLTRQLLGELADVFQVFCAVAPAPWYRLTLKRTNSQACPLFHVDRVTVRLLCTLRGPGTEWLADGDVCRAALGKQANDRVVAGARFVQQLGRYQVGFLKGEKYPGARGHGVVHRSPPVAPRGEGRWFLRLDAATGGSGRSGRYRRQSDHDHEPLPKVESR